MNSRTVAIARNTFIESLRQPVLLLLVLGSGLLQILITWMSAFSLADTESSEVQGDAKILLDVGLSTVFGCGALIAGFIATSAISREIENKTVLTVVSKPVPRTVVVIGKFIGVCGAIAIATLIMLIFLLFAVRHGVMSTTADKIDQPVMLFSFGAVAIAMLGGAWCNFFYRWNFPQAATLLLLPLSLIGYAGVLALSKEWKLQPLTVDFKPQITLACACLALAIFVLTSVAIAASTRLGQVMTIVVCFGVFVASLMSNFFIGRHVFQNSVVAEIQSATPVDPSKPSLANPGESFKIELRGAPARALRPGESFYFSPSPGGYPMMTPRFPDFAGSLDKGETMLGPDVPPGLIVTSAQGQTVEIRHIGGSALSMIRPPGPGDFVLDGATRVNYAALAVWGILPNMQFFWLLDPVSQNRTIPPVYLALALLYALCQASMFLALAVLLFEGRDVG